MRQQRTTGQGAADLDFAVGLPGMRLALGAEMRPHNTPSFSCLQAIGILSGLSGTVMVVVPQSSARLYGLPSRRTLVRLLGVRDVLIGFYLCNRSPNRVALLWRVASELFDACLIARNAHAHHRNIVGALKAGVAITAAGITLTLSLSRR